MPSSHQQTSANTGRKTHTKSSRVSGASYPLQTSMPSSVNALATAQDAQEQLLDDLKDANTELNRITSERDRYYRLYEQANNKLSESHAAKEDLKTQVLSLRDDNAALRQKIKELEKENTNLVYANDLWDKHYTMLERNYHKIVAEFNAAPSVSSGASLKLPERPKPSHRSSSKKGHKEERSKKGEKESREKKAEKERLSRRFDENRPSTSGRRQSFIEPWGPSVGAAPTPPAPSRGFTDIKAPAGQSAHNNVAFSAVPRSTNPLSPGAYKHGATNLYDEGYEDGNYHAFPVAR
ncbi:hypothetical protein HIM_00306 [Hirsutella minnesotensis 3608]|nr:hypothetical protein HIM_00306 [Hirsutella minnesotensis 3608]